MSYYWGKTFTTTLSGSVIKPVTCERCRKEYFYELARSAKGQGHAPYNIGQEAAARRAQESAEKKLAKRLATEHEAVGCAHCGWVQDPMVAHLRRRHLRWLLILVWVVMPIALAALGAYVWIRHADDRLSDELRNELMQYGVLVIVAGGALLSLRWMLARRIDPNANYPQRSPPLPGTPPALLKRMVDGVETLIAVQQQSEVLRGNWAEVQLERCQFPQQCCVCLGPAGVEFQTPLTSWVKVPMCAACRGKALRRWWKWAGVGISLGLATAGAISFSIPGLDDSGRWAAAFLGAIIPALIFVLILTRRGRVYRQKTIDASRGVVRLWFQNQHYTRRLADAYRSRVTLDLEPAPVRSTFTESAG
jgi:hypothetical protein